MSADCVLYTPCGYGVESHVSVEAGGGAGQGAADAPGEEAAAAHLVRKYLTNRIFSISRKLFYLLWIRRRRGDNAAVRRHILVVIKLQSPVARISVEKT